MTIAEILVATREQAHLTQAQVAKASGVSHSYIARLETAAIVDPSLSTLVALAKGYGVTVSEMLSDLSQTASAVK